MQMELHLSPADNLFAAAHDCLMCVQPQEKVARTRALARRFGAGGISLQRSDDVPHAVPVPGRPARPRLVSPHEVARRSLGTEEGRAALVHAIAHIEFNAINLALDAVYRFRDMPDDYYRDWVCIADDEARHFQMLTARLHDMGRAYGDFDAHNGLWEMAVRTADSCLARMALVPRVLEARGLDVTPAMIMRLQQQGDTETCAILEQILVEEVPHVAAGTRWFHWCCAEQGVQPEPTFHALLAQHDVLPRPPFNRSARLEAGFSDGELGELERLAADGGRA